MITRPVRVSFPCSYLSNIKFRTHWLKLHTDPEQKIHVENPFIWSPCSSYLCENVGKNVVKKLDINSMVKTKADESRRLSVYPNITSNLSFLKKDRVEHAQQKNNDSPFMILEKNKMLLNMLTNDNLSLNLIRKTEERVFQENIKKDLNLHENISQSAIEKRKDNKMKSKLPSKKQLDDVMMHFIEQAPALFTSSGWSYRKCSYNIVFENTIIGTKTESLNAYIMQINFMKNLAKFMLSKPELDIFRMTKCVSDGSIHVRWQVHGIPRYLKPFSLLPFVDDRYFNRCIDGYSIFYINSDGLYHRHVLMKLTPIRTDDKNYLTTHFFSLIGFRRPGFDGDLPKQPVLPAFHDAGK